MPTDHARADDRGQGAVREVLATIRDVESQAEWIPEILEAELLEVYEDDDLPATAAFKASATVGTDRYTLSYEHADDGMSWTMVKGTCRPDRRALHPRASSARDLTSVTYDLTIHHNLPLPGFIRGRVIKGLVDSTLTGLKEHLEG